MSRYICGDSATPKFLPAAKIRAHEDHMNSIAETTSREGWDDHYMFDHDEDAELGDFLCQVFEGPGDEWPQQTMAL